MIDGEALREFERNLDPWRMDTTQEGARVLGYGEISTVFALRGQPGIAFKRMPLFATVEQAYEYAEHYRCYTGFLREAGLDLPEDGTAVVEVPGRPVVLYIAQEQMPAERFGHSLIRRLDSPGCKELLESVADRLSRVWSFNESHRPSVELSVDGQISNWVLLENGRLCFVDTSTPMFRLDGVEQLDPELFLASAPSFLRWLLRLAFLDEVMSRYYDPRRVFLDLVANLFKEHREELVAVALPVVNAHLGKGTPITAEEVRKYYSGDKIIWAVFLAFRRFDRWVKTRIGRRRYEFVLPGRIER